MLELPFPPSKLNPNRKTHWFEKGNIARKYRRDCGWLAKTHPPLKKFTITFHPPDKRKRDRDNYIAAFKAGQDGLADAWGIDDSQFEITYAPLGEPIKGGKVVVE